MEARKILTVIGNVSTGKSSFLNYLLGSDILQTGDGLKTRFIVIIRHTENDEPVLSHIIRKRNLYEDLYIKVKDEQGKIEYKGKKEIIEKINSLNILLKKDEDEGKLDYANHLYLLETRIKNIHNQDFLNNFDLADIPGLNNMSKKENNFGSIKGIFTPLKRLIKYGFLIFDSLQYRAENIVLILTQLMSEEKIKFNNFLIILNKIDRIPTPQEREAAFLQFKAYLNSKFGDDLLSDTNSIIKMNSLELLEEENVMENFNNFLSYHFKKVTNDTYEKYFKKLVCYGYYMNNKSGPRKKYSDIEKILEPDNELDEEFLEQISKISESVGLKLNLDPDEDEEHYENICKLFNLLKLAFSKKDVYFYKTKSEYRKKIDEFFDKKDFISLSSDEAEIKDEFKIVEINEENNEKNKIVNGQLIKCMEKLKLFYRDNIQDLQSKSNKTGKKQKNINIKSLGERMENLEKLIACHDKVRITVYGTYSAGKSSTLNSFIGKQLLQVDYDECTAKPILIRYLKKDEKPKIYRAELKVVKDYDKFSHYGFLEKGKALAEGEEAVRNFISSQNINAKNPDEKKDKGDDFFILKTPIKILDELGLSEEIKNNVEFLDTPGINTGKKNPELLDKLIEQTFIYIFIIDPSVGGADTEDFKQVLETTLLKTIYNRSIVNNSINFPYLFICNKCDNENIDFNIDNCNKNINLIIKSENEKFDIVKFSAHKRTNILNKMKEYTPENFIEKVEMDFFNILYSSSKTFYTFLNDYILKDFKQNFDGQICQKFEENKLIKDKLIKILKEKNYEVNEEKEEILSKLSGYLYFCNNNFDKLKISDNKMMNELKDKIKTKINMAYDHITKGYRNQVRTALDFIKNFIKIGIIPDSDSKRFEEKDIKKAEKILKDVVDILEKYNIPKDLQEFRQKIFKELESKEGLREDYNNFEEILKKKENFINNSLKQLSERSIPNSFENIQKGIIEVIEKNIEGIEIYIENGQMIIREKPSYKGAAKNISRALLLAGVGTFVSGAVYTFALEQAILGGIVLSMTAVQPGILAFGAICSISEAGSVAAGLTSLLTPIGWFALLAGGAAATVYCLSQSVSSFNERKKQAYDDAILKIKEKFFSIFDGFEKKITQQYNANKEKIIEEAASNLNMCYDPIKLDESQKQELVEKYNNLEENIKNLINKGNSS